MKEQTKDQLNEMVDEDTVQPTQVIPEIREESEVKTDDIVLPQQMDSMGWLFAKLQSGSVDEFGVNGVNEIDFINVAIGMLRSKNNIEHEEYNREISFTITKLEEGLLWLNSTQGVI